METTRTQSQPVQSNTALARQKPGQAPAGNEAAAQGGFLALLAALGTDESVASAALAGSGGETALATAASDEEPADEAESLASAQSLLLAGLPVQPLPEGLPPGSAGMGAPWVQGLAGAEGAALAIPLGQTPLLDGLVAQTAQMDAAAVTGGTLAAATVGMSAARPQSALSHKGAAGAWTGAGGFLATQERALGLGGTQAAAGPAALAGSDGAAATAGASSALWAQLQGAQHGASADLREGGAALAAALEESAGALVAAALPSRAQDQGQGQSQPQGGTLAAGSEVSAAEGALHPMGEASYEAAMAAAEEALSEQVTYWVNQNMQKAQLTVEHDGGAVSVSVALQGNEAHVSLMADQAQARDLLDADQAQLRELLRQQGLDLAGLTVGLSAQRQGGEPQGQSSGQPADPRGGAAPQDGPERTARVGVRVLTDRAVDLFV